MVKFVTEVSFHSILISRQIVNLRNDFSWHTDCCNLVIMLQVEENQKRSAILEEPTFRHVEEGGLPQPPSVVELFSELFRALNFIKFPTHTLLTLNFFLYFQTSLVFFVFVYRYLSLGSVIFAVACVCFLGTIYNTVWFHRYCCHSAYHFKKARYSYLFLWTNPLSFIFREEVYAIPHRIHHEQTERQADPYGPHLGWLGSFLSTELTQRLNTDITERDYEMLTSGVSHIGLRKNTFEQFKKTGSIENINQYLSRAVFAQLFWTGVVFGFGGTTYLMAWYASCFIATSLIRDFNWRAHGGHLHRDKKPGWEFDKRSYALNQRFYGYIASEWHDNHHKYPTSASNGFLPGQIDIAFHVIKILCKFGIVQSYIDSYPRFKEEILPTT